MDKVRLLVRFVMVEVVQLVTITEIIFAADAEVLERKYVKDVGVLEWSNNRNKYAKMRREFESVFWEQNRTIKRRKSESVRAHCVAS